MVDEATYRSLRRKADKIVKNKEVVLSEEEQVDLLRLAHELEVAYVELEVQNEELRKATRDLVASRNEYYDLYESAPVALFTLSSSGVIEKINAAAIEILANHQNHLIGRSFMSLVSKDDLHIWYRHMQKTAIENRSAFFELRLAGRNHGRIHVHVQASPKFDVESRFSHWLMAVFDVSEQRRREQKLQQVHEQLEMAANAAELGMWNFDPSSETSRWNEMLYRLLGLEPRPGPEPGKRFFEFIHPEERVGILESMQAVVKGGSDHIQEEFRIVRPDGQIRWLASRGRMYRDEDGRLNAICGINYDITDRKEAEETVRLAQVRLVTQMTEVERVNQELSEYAYAVSHDLKGPLRAIHNYADFLYEDLAGSLTGDQKKYLEGMKRAVNQGNALIEDLLSFSRIGREPLEMVSIDVPELVEEIRAMLQIPSDSEIVFERQWPDFCADRSILKQIFQNLISNAFKFNHSSPKHIDIGWQPAANDMIDIYVCDNGIGIDPQYEEQIFRIFHRLHTQQDFDGTGIGLAIVQKGAHKLGGSVRLESEPGKGSTFYVTLPRQPGDPGQ